MRRLLLFILILSGVLFSCTRQPEKLPQVSGHRGANCLAPENTLASADSCIKYGVDVMETDVTISSDSVFYLLHDQTLDRTTNGTGDPYAHSSSYLDSLDAGSWFGEQWKGQHMPRFQTLLRRAKEGGLDITVDYRKGDFGKLVELIESEGMLEHTYFTFSQEEDAVAFRRQFPDIHTLQGYVTDIADIDRAEELYSPDIIVNWIDNLTPEFVKACHDRGLKVLALVLGLEDKTAENRKAVELGVDVVATDRPVQFMRQFGMLKK